MSYSLERESFKLVHAFFGMSLNGIGFEIKLVEVKFVKCEGDATKEPGSF